jgi:hypothetical protein
MRVDKHADLGVPCVLMGEVALLHSLLHSLRNFQIRHCVLESDQSDKAVGR